MYIQHQTWDCGGSDLLVGVRWVHSGRGLVCRATKLVTQNLHAVYQQVLVGNGCWFPCGSEGIIHGTALFLRQIIKVLYSVVERKKFVRIERYVPTCTSLVPKLIQKLQMNGFIFFNCSRYYSGNRFIVFIYFMNKCIWRINKVIS